MEWGMHTKRFWSFVVSKALLLIVLITPALSYAAGVEIPAGATVTLNGGSLNLDCTDLLIDGDFSLGSGTVSAAADISISGGTMDAGSGLVSLAGNWTNNGEFIASSSQVDIVDGCGKSTSIVSGNNVFNAFSTVSAIGKKLQIEAGSEQTFLDSLGLQGVMDKLLLIRSTSPGNQVFFNLMPMAVQDISYVDVQDNNALAGGLIAPGTPGFSNSIDSGNNYNWFSLAIAIPAIAIPTLSLLAQLLLVMTLLFAACRRLPLFVKSDR